MTTPAATGLRVGAAVALAYAAGGWIPRVGKLLTPLAAIAVVAAYVVFLLATRELGRDDVAQLRAMLRRGPKS